MSLNILNYPLGKNRCYQQNVKRTPVGIQIHSIGCAQGTGKAVADSFNNATTANFVTYICDADVPGKVYQCGSEELYTWADAGYGNRNLITVEIAESDYMAYKPNSATYTITDQAKFKADILRGYDTAVALCAEICKRRKWDPNTKLEHGLYLISSHDEGRIAGTSSAHFDPTHIWSQFGLSMDTFRRAVKVAMERGATVETEPVVKYRVRKSWTDAASQTNAYENLDLAKAEADRHPGYSVYNEKGEAVYASKELPVLGGIPSSKEAFIEAVSKIAVELYSKTKILPSVVIGQCCLETGYGLGSDSTELVKVNNLLGMKADLINNTWKDFTVWNGKSIKKKTPEEKDGKVIYKYDYFRVYDNYEQCITDYEMFLLNVKNDNGYKYRQVAGMTDPKEVITAISKGGYATDSGYISKVMAVINANSLTQYDKKVIPVPVKDKYVVRRKLGEKKYQLGAFSNLKNAKKKANENWGYKVYNIETRELVYSPKITVKQMFIAKMIQFDNYVQDDNAAGKQWYYYNGKASKGSFWATRKANMRWTNCCGGVQLAAYAAGVPKKALCWYLQRGKIVWLNNHAEADAKEYFDIIKVGNKTLNQCIKDGTVVPGDILGYMTLSHTNAYPMPGFTFDSGHLWCEGKGEGAKYTRWVGPLAYGNYKISYIFRIKK